MKYEQPKTRIKQVTEGFDVWYYAQYKVVIIPFLWEEWYTIRLGIHNPDSVSTAGEAEQRIDKFLEDQVRLYAYAVEAAARIKYKKSVMYFKYPHD
jgi:hypothetical protein